jgi:hypothetical protein
MSAPAFKSDIGRALAVLELRTWARAYLWSAGEFPTIADAVDDLQGFAEHSSLVRTIGQDAVQAVLAREFGGVRR